MVREFKLRAADGEARKGSSGVVTTDYSVIFCPPPYFFVSCLSSSFFSAFLSWFFSDLIIYSFNEAQLANGFPFRSVPFRSVPTVPILATYGTGLQPVGKATGPGSVRLVRVACEKRRKNKNTKTKTKNRKSSTNEKQQTTMRDGCSGI